MENSKLTVGVVIPIFNPGDYFIKVLQALSIQSYPIRQLTIIDSGNKPWDNISLIEDMFPDIGIEIIKILSKDFDHGGTRNLGALRQSNLDYVLFLTQDAVMLPECLQKLIEFVKGHDLVATYARQIPRDGATEIEILERDFIYPNMSRISNGKVTTMDDVFSSDVCSLVRLSTFLEVGGFPDKIIASEDMVVALKLIQEKYKIGYCADALVKHSHNFKFNKLLGRYFDIGVMHKMWEKSISFNSVSGKGKKFITKAIKHILFKKQTEIFKLITNIFAKAIGYYLGKNYELLNVSIRRRISGNKAFWG